MLSQNFVYGDFSAAEKLRATLDDIRRTAADHRRLGQIDARGEAAEVYRAIEELTAAEAVLSTETIARHLALDPSTGDRWKGEKGIDRVSKRIADLRASGHKVGAILREGVRR
jgi:hypothetical protein